MKRKTTKMKLERSFYVRDGLVVAKDLLGKVLVHKKEEEITKGRIVEVEAYMGPDDKAAHSSRKKSVRTQIQYGLGGYCYVYLIYGMYYCMNIVTNICDIPQVVLIRALEPLEGIDSMKKRRKTENVKNLCSGPGKLCLAMDISKNQYGQDLCGDEMYVEKDDFILMPEDILATKRINIDYAGEAVDYEWRFLIEGNPYVSVKEKKV